MGMQFAEVEGMPGGCVVVDGELPPNTIYMMPTDILELIIEAREGLLSWDYVNDEVLKAARKGRIGVITNIG